MAVTLTISGQIPSGPTTANVTYFVIEKSANAVVGNINLPNASTTSHAFNLSVPVANAAGDYDVGLFDEIGAFVSAGFKVDLPQQPTGAVGPQ